MAMLRNMGMQKFVTLILTILSIVVELVSSDGYSCNCDCGPNAGGGRCSLQLPSIEYLNSGGTCQAIKLDNTRQQCVKNVITDAETEDIMCWTMPKTACMCREPVGSYNLMCECDGKGIFCGSEQNNCVCELLEADRDIGVTIGIAVGTSIIGLFIITFTITIIYFIRRARIEQDPWYQFDKQFKRFMAKKEREKAAGIKKPVKKHARTFGPAHLNPSTGADVKSSADVTSSADFASSADVTSSVDVSIATKQPLVSPTSDEIRERRPSNTDPNWLLAARFLANQQSETEMTPPNKLVSGSTAETNKAKLMGSTADSTPDSLNFYSAEPGQSSDSAHIYSSSITESSLENHEATNMASWSTSVNNRNSDSIALVHQAASMAYDDNIYDAID